MMYHHVYTLNWPVTMALCISDATPKALGQEFASVLLSVYTDVP